MSEAREVKAAFNALPPSPPPTGTPLSPIPQQALPLLKPHEASPPPSVQNARQSATRWREGNQLARITREKTPIGTTFSFSLNEQATVSFSFTQILHRDRRCLHNAHKMQRKGCGDTVTRGTLSFAGHSGMNNVAFSGRVSRANKLKAGRYKLVITAINSAGQRSAPVSLGFTITR
jgi:hypothetical protein